MSQMKFETFLPHFSGFKSPDWEPLVSGPQRRAAQGYAKEEAEGGLDAEDYMRIFGQMGVSTKQHSFLARQFTLSFAIQLAYSMASPNGLLFDRYDYDADRIVATIPLWSIRRLVMLFKLDNLAPLLGDWENGPVAGELDPAVTECFRRFGPIVPLIHVSSPRQTQH